MICWDRTESMIIGTFLRPQLDWLDHHFDCLDAALAARMRCYGTDYPLGEIVGIALPAEHSDDPVLLALIDYYMSEEPPEIRLLWEAELFEQLREALRTAGELVPDDGGTVLLTDDATLTGWLWAVEALSVATAAAAGRPELMREPRPEPTRPEDAPSLLITWLRGIFESLTTIAYPATAG